MNLFLDTERKFICVYITFVLLCIGVIQFYVIVWMYAPRMILPLYHVYSGIIYIINDMFFIRC